jgi:hypothetical protein
MNSRNTLSKLTPLIVPTGTSTRAIRLAVGLLFLALLASASEAQQRTFVSGLGNDGNPCSRAAPCRTFTQALTLTNSGGEVVVLDSAGYGAFAISQAVPVQAPPGVYAGISVFSGDGITITAGGSDTVILRGLTVNNQGSNGNGISFNTGGTLHIERCVVNGFAAANGAGVLFGGAGKLEVKDSIMRGNNNGIAVAPVSGIALASADHVRLEGNTQGLQANDGSKVNVSNSVVSNNGTGFQAISFVSHAELNIENCIVSGNSADGVVADSLSTGLATVRVSDTTVANNGTGLNNFFSVVLSRGNNTVEGNTTNTSGTIGSYTAK